MASMKKLSLLLGQCIPTLMKRKGTVEVVVQQMALDENLNMKFFNYFVSDPQTNCKVGDIVLVRELPEKMSLDITHELVKVVYPFGDIIDPITQEPCVTRNYRKDRELLYTKYNSNDGIQRGFDYNKAPERGWQKGKKDFSDRIGYVKYHEFPEGHPLHNDPATS